MPSGYGIYVSEDDVVSIDHADADRMADNLMSVKRWIESRHNLTKYDDARMAWQVLDDIICELRNQ